MCGQSFVTGNCVVTTSKFQFGEAFFMAGYSTLEGITYPLFITCDLYAKQASYWHFIELSNLWKFTQMVVISNDRTFGVISPAWCRCLMIYLLLTLHVNHSGTMDLAQLCPIVDIYTMQHICWRSNLYIYPSWHSPDKIVVCYDI